MKNVKKHFTKELMEQINEEGKKYFEFGGEEWEEESVDDNVQEEQSSIESFEEEKIPQYSVDFAELNETVDLGGLT